MNVVVTGLECSGTKLMTRILNQHPDIAASHTSIPVGWMPDTFLPKLHGYDSVIWMLRYEPFRWQSLEHNGYSKDRPDDLKGPGLIQTCEAIYADVDPLFVPYEGIIGPLRDMLLDAVLRFIQVPDFTFDTTFITDENRKYWL